MWHDYAPGLAGLIQREFYYAAHAPQSALEAGFTNGLLEEMFKILMGGSELDAEIGKKVWKVSELLARRHPKAHTISLPMLRTLPFEWARNLQVERWAPVVDMAVGLIDRMFPN